jgi:hypothetical protein
VSIQFCSGQPTRREFLRNTSLAMAGGTAALVGARVRCGMGAELQTGDNRSGPDCPRPLTFSADMRDGLRPRRVTNAMWDFSWLPQHYPGGAFADFDKAAAELVERKFNTVRIDAFPLIIGALHSEDERITIPATPLANWGMSDRDRQYAPARELVEFMRAARREGLSVILSSWGDTRCCKEYPSRAKALAQDRDGFCKAWQRTLDILGSHDLLDHVLYVDLDQEFPYFSPFIDLQESKATPIRSQGGLADRIV